MLCSRERDCRRGRAATYVPGDVVARPDIQNSVMVLERRSRWSVRADAEDTALRTPCGGRDECCAEDLQPAEDRTLGLRVALVIGERSSYYAPSASSRRGVAVDAQLEQEVRRQTRSVRLVLDAGADVVVPA